MGMSPVHSEGPTRETKLRRDFVEGRIEVEEFEYRMEHLLRTDSAHLMPGPPRKPRPASLDTGER